MSPLSLAVLDTRVVPDHEATPPECQRLWQQVLSQAVADALDARDVDRTDDLGEALAWFRTEDYAIVAERAGYDPEVFLARFREYQLAMPLRLGYGGAA